MANALLLSSITISSAIIIFKRHKQKNSEVRKRDPSRYALAESDSEVRLDSGVFIQSSFKFWPGTIHRTLSLKYYFNDSGFILSLGHDLTFFLEEKAGAYYCFLNRANLFL